MTTKAQKRKRARASWLARQKQRQAWRQEQAERLAETLATGGFGEGESGTLAADEFVRTWDRARLGRILVPERVRALYPLLREIVDEVEESEQEDARYEKRRASAMRGWQRRRQAEGRARG